MTTYISTFDLNEIRYFTQNENYCKLNKTGIYYNRCYIVAQIYVCKTNKIISITYYPIMYVFANESMNIKL